MLGFALWRVPYDDEQFSLALAFDTDVSTFWRALARDVHPPWVAVTDRALAALSAGRGPLHAARVLVAMAAVASAAPWLARRLRVPRWAIWLAACHPIVFMYSGAVRWYPWLFLAHALRGYALWAEGHPRRREAAFALGCALGPATGYVDAMFVLHDCGWWLVRTAGRTRPLDRTLAWSIAGAGVAAVLVWMLVSPLGISHGMGRRLWFDPRSAFTFFALGAAGDAGPPFPFWLAAVLGPIVLARGLAAVLGQRETRAFGAYVLSYAAAWALSTLFRAWHPRYALWLWLLLAACALTLVRGSRLDRRLLTAAAAYFALVLALMFGQRHYYKSDLNVLHARDCAHLRSATPPELAVVPYDRLAYLIETQCRLEAPIVSLRSIRIFPDYAARMRELWRRLAARPREVWLVSIDEMSSLGVTEMHVRKELAARCRLLDAHGFGVVPHRALTNAFRSRPRASRFNLTRYDCRAPEQTGASDPVSPRERRAAGALGDEIARDVP